MGSKKRTFAGATRSGDGEATSSTATTSAVKVVSGEQRDQGEELINKGLEISGERNAKQVRKNAALHVGGEENPFAILDEEVFAEIDGYKVSNEVKRKLREENRIEETVALTYGEIRCTSFAELLNEFLPECRGFFVDIGSGTGKAVLTAAMSGFSRCLGVEIVGKLHDCAMTGFARAKGKEGLIPDSAQIEFIVGDSFANVDKWQGADVIFAPTTCFTDELMEQLSASLKKVKPGAYIINTTRMIKSNDVKLISKKRSRYARGSLEFMLWRRVPIPPTTEEK